jgi:hypothetical protein
MRSSLRVGRRSHGAPDIQGTSRLRQDTARGVGFEPLRYGRMLVSQRSASLDGIELDYYVRRLWTGRRPADVSG